MVTKSKTKSETEADPVTVTEVDEATFQAATEPAFELVDALPTIVGGGRTHVPTVEDRIVEALTGQPDGKVAAVPLVDGANQRRRFREAAGRVGKAANTREVDGKVYVQLVAKRPAKAKATAKSDAAK